MADNKLIIIGAGIAGLATGCYARMNGYDVEIFEMHTQLEGSSIASSRDSQAFGKRSKS